jgi:hypothetical protein
MPIYFEKNKKETPNHTYFYKNPTNDKNNKISLNFNKLFNSYSKYSYKMTIPSIYNSIYYSYKDLSEPEVLGIIRIKSNEYMPRFQFAYDSDDFTKEEIVYIIHYILKNI